MLSLPLAATDPGTSPLIYVLIALLGGSALDVGFRIYQRVRHGAREDAIQIAQAAQDAVESSQELFSKYKVELQDAKVQLNQYLEQLIDVNRQLGAATARIAKLEEELHHSLFDRKQLHEQLIEAQAQRVDLLAQIERLTGRIHSLERDIAG